MGEMGGGSMPAMSPAAHHRMMVDMAMSTEQLPWALVAGLLTAVTLGALVLWTPWPIAPQGASGVVGEAPSAVGELLLTRYMVVFEGAAMLILAGIAGGVILGRRERANVSQRHPSPEGTSHRRAADGVPTTAQDPDDHHTMGGKHMHDSEAHHAAGRDGVWTCPMHPEVRSQGPGKCPKCGMDLVPAETLKKPGPARGGSGGSGGPGGTGGR